MTGKKAARGRGPRCQHRERESVDEAKQQRHLTKGETRRLNQIQENRNSRRIIVKSTSGPARAQAARDAGMMAKPPQNQPDPQQQRGKRAVV